MNIKKFLKWSLVLMAFIDYKQIEGIGGTDPSASSEPMTYQSAKR